MPNLSQLVYTVEWFLCCATFYTPAQWRSKLVTGCYLKRSVIFCQLELGRALPMFWLNPPVVIRLKVTQVLIHSCPDDDGSIQLKRQQSLFSELSWYLPLQITACDTFYWASVLQVTNTMVWRPRYEFYFFLLLQIRYFLSAHSSSHLSLQSLYQPPMFGWPQVCDQWGVGCNLRLQITRWVFTGQGSDGLWQRWKDLPEPVPPWSNSVQQWNKYILQACRKLFRYVFYPGEVRSSHWSWKSMFEDHFISQGMMIDFAHSGTATSWNRDHYCKCVYKVRPDGAKQVSHQKVV